LNVVAEGVESQEIWDELRAQGCSLAQGYFISRPLPAGDLAPALGAPTLRRVRASAAVAG
jgi:EAL domain-containing protein (putative c-di-GMP-specific phosphodiesterase class I)